MNINEGQFTSIEEALKAIATGKDWAVADAAKLLLKSGIAKQPHRDDNGQPENNNAEQLATYVRSTDDGMIYPAGIYLGSYNVMQDALEAWANSNYDKASREYVYGKFGWLRADLHEFLKSKGIAVTHLVPADAPAAKVAKVSKGKAGRPKTMDKKVIAVRDMIARFERAALIQFTPQALSGSAADLLDACNRFEKSNKIKPREFCTSQDTFNGWLKRAGYSFPTGRTQDIEKDYWTQLVEKVLV
jgi:hypothetical protein